jgi:hypothetical protein
MSGRVALVVAALAVVAIAGVHGQGRGGAPPAPAGPPRQSAPLDITGYWVAYITEDWRYRMITPPKGDYARVPLTPEGRKLADAWDPAADEASGSQCKAYGAAAIMRVPGRIHITWQDDTTLKVESDAGTQTRLLRFESAAPSREHTWQGDSTARWDVPGRALAVTTTNMRAGYLRWNGVPYGDNATMNEYFDLSPLPGGGQLLIVTTTVESPGLLARPFTVSSHFKQERDGSKWNPIPCTARW